MHTNEHKFNIPHTLLYWPAEISDFFTTYTNLKIGDLPSFK